LHTRILIPAASGPDDGKPNLVRYAKPIHGLQDAIVKARLDPVACTE
jgi:hypothetical protein